MFRTVPERKLTPLQTKRDQDAIMCDPTEREYHPYGFQGGQLSCEITVATLDFVRQRLVLRRYALDCIGDARIP
jgi:hypothetical protein